MKRRNFVGSMLLAGAYPLVNAVAGKTPLKKIADNSLPPYFTKIIEANDRQVQQIIPLLIVDRAHRWYGGVMGGEGFPSAHSTSGAIGAFIAAYVSPTSRYYRSSYLREKLELISKGLLQFQHDDGSIDLMSTNFHSTPDTAFIVEQIAPSYSLLVKQNDPSTKAIRQLLQQFLRNTGKTLLVGGIHTPNHRWVVCMALSWLYHFFGDAAYKARIDQWLNEKIDLDPDGQFNEQSTIAYSPVCDRELIITGRLMGYDYLFDYVRKNLDMTLYYIHPNGEVVTEASNRQDKYQRGYASPYYLPYRYFAVKDQNATFAAMVEDIEQRIHPSELLGYLTRLLDDPLLCQPLPEGGTLPVEYRKEFSYSKLVRIRRGNQDMTIIGNNPSFFSFTKGNAVLQAVRFASAFFGRGQFQSPDVVKEGDSYVLRYELSRGYYQPFPVDQLPPDGDWHKMPRDERPRSEMQTQKVEVRITEQGGKARLELKADSGNVVPFALELGFRKGGLISNVDTTTIADSYLLGKDGCSYRMGADEIRVSCKQVCEHTWTQIRGGLPKLDAQCVYLTGFTPCRIELEIS